MSDKSVILSIDQGTTSSRTLVFSLNGELLYTAQEPFQQYYPQDGWVEHDPEDIWTTVLSTLRDAYDYCAAEQLTPLGLGITNQRETTLVWDRKTGHAIYKAIVWQDRRTAEYCQDLKSKGFEPLIREKTGLLLDPYFSASKIGWILEAVDGAREQAEKGELAFGTVDSFLIWRLSSGKTHATDATNASRTSLFNIRDNMWDDELCNCFNIPKAILPEVKDCSDDYGHVSPDILPIPLPICGVVGDQQGALIGQGCFASGEMKSTYGTGCFIVANTGDEILQSNNQLLSTVAYRLNGRLTYALEGSIFVAGAAIQWLRDGLELFEHSSQTDAMAKSAQDNPDLVFVPALTGLGAPHWNPNARGAIFGLTRAASRADFVRAALEGISFQTHDLLEAMKHDGLTPKTLRVDGGMVANDWFRQNLANIIHIDVECPPLLETTALGAARLAGEYLGCENMNITQDTLNTAKTIISVPKADENTRKMKLRQWEKAILATQSFSE